MSEINYQALRGAAEQAMHDDWGFDADLFHELATPSIVLELLDERERNQQYIKRRDQENEDIALTVGKLRVELEEVKQHAEELSETKAVRNQWRPDICPITGRAFFMWIEHPTLGNVPTYGGPLDSYTIPTKDGDGEFSCERYDHDFGGWVESECLGLYLIDDREQCRVYELEERVKELDAREISLPERSSMLHRTDFHDDYQTVMAYKVSEVIAAIRAAMLQSGNFRENKNSSTNNFREIAETSTNYPVIPSEVLSAIREVAKIRADFDDFDGDRRGIGDCLDEAEQELIVTINKYASQLAAEPIAPNDVREQTAIPQVPVTPDGWISCSERMPPQDDWILIYSKHGEYMAGQVQGEYVELSDGTLSWLGNALFWMPLPEPPQEVNRD